MKIENGTVTHGEIALSVEESAAVMYLHGRNELAKQNIAVDADILGKKILKNLGHGEDIGFDWTELAESKLIALNNDMLGCTVSLTKAGTQLGRMIESRIANVRPILLALV